jgi:hypothetical protein
MYMSKRSNLREPSYLDLRYRFGDYQEYAKSISKDKYYFMFPRFDLASLYPVCASF